MTMAETEDPLERFFAAGRQAGQAPSEALLARVEADALRELDAHAAPVGTGRPGGVRGVLAALGGWRVGAGLATAAVAGLLIGISLPTTLTGLDGLATPGDGYELGDLAPGYGLAFLEDG
jgi:hypothetical protein